MERWCPDDEDSDDDGYSYEKMEHNGWYESDCHIILGQCELKPVDGVDGRSVRDRRSQ